MVNVLADKYIYKLDTFLPGEVELDYYDPKEPLSSVPPGTDALLTRTRTSIDTNFISQFPESLQFIATASAGTDHVDIAKLRNHQIKFTNAAGCNARSVAEYVVTAIILWAGHHNRPLHNLTVGIVGVGHAGGQTATLLNELGVTTIKYDPPRANHEESFQTASLGEVLAADILTFHTPLSFEGDYATCHWLDEEKLQHPFDLIINASRGGVVDEQTLFEAYQSGRVGSYILDVWENEPVFNDPIAQNAFFHTPHIAGYSIQAKLNASRMVTEALCGFFNLNQQKKSSPQKQRVTNLPPTASIAGLVGHLHPIKKYHQKFSKLIGQSNQKKRSGFSTIRTSHPLRNEYQYLRLPDDIRESFPIFEVLCKNIDTITKK